MGKTKLSVIIPVYGVGPYIERCARSLFEQTLDDIEYIFVDDCSPDRSIDILQNVANEYPERLGQIHIIRHPKNQGSAIARRSGMEAATGEYIIHCDSDDWPAKNAYKLMYDKAKIKNADLVVCNYSISDGMGHLSTPERTSCLHSDRISFIRDMLYQKVKWSLCNKMFRRSLLQQYTITFPTQPMGEDSAITLQLAYYCKKIVHIDQALYFYFQRPGSIVNNSSTESLIKKFQQASDNSGIVRRFYEQKGMGAQLKDALNFMDFSAKMLLLPLLGRKGYYRKIWNSAFPGLEYRIIKDSHSPRKIRLKCLMIILHLYPGVTNKIRLTHCK
ncbi:MAG: glycosyltransferase family 2 protein [Prevotella sp.]|nr:glycosyltransferase family 2 protein [Prevotella sp.]